MTKCEGEDVTNVVVLEHQLTERMRKIHWDRGEVVVGQVQDFQEPEKKEVGISNDPQMKFLPLDILAIQANSTRIPNPQQTLCFIANRLLHSVVGDSDSSECRVGG